MRHNVYLIPGFFGFATFGDFKYFAHVRGVLEDALRREGLQAEVHYVMTPPTASLTKRAATLADTIKRTDPDDACVIHLVGHSAGGIDARLLTSDGVELPTHHPIEPISARVRSLTTITSPNYGAPQARILSTTSGRSLLKALSMLTLHSLRFGAAPLSALVALAGAFTGGGDLGGPGLAIVNQIYRQLLQDFDAERRQVVDEYLTAAAEDQALLGQLTPEAMQVFNATVRERAEVRKGCVIAMSAEPTLSDSFALGLSPVAQATHGLYRALYALATTFPAAMAPSLDAAQRRALESVFGDVPDVTANDGMVPVRSQPFGEVIHVARADHMDVIGHLHGPETTPPHVDWLTTRSGFTRDQFQTLWSDVAAFVARS